MLASSTTKPGHHNNAKQIQNMLYDQNMISVAPFHSQYLWLYMNKKKIEHALFIINVGYDNKIFYGTFRISIHNDGIPKIILLFWCS